MQNLIFCVYNVVLYILILELKHLFLLYDIFLYALINVW